MKRLTQNLSSQYFAAASKLRPSRTRRRIVAYVESFDDIAFWRSVLDEFEDDTRYFEILLPGRDTLGKGKRLALMNVLSEQQLGTSMIACVDADYDYLLSNSNPTSRFIQQSPYVVHTFVYAIENYQCYAPSLHRAVVTATLNDRPTLDFEAVLREYSIIIWPLFVWNIWGYYYNDYHGFTLTDFCGFVSLDKNFNTRHPEESLAALRRRVNQKMSWLQRHRPQARNNLQRVRQHLLDLGVTPETTYLFIQGHTLMDTVVLPMLEPICTMLRKEREREIRNLAVHSTQRQNELASYQHSQLPIEVVLRKNIGFRSAPIYQRVRERIKRALNPKPSTLNPSGTPDAPKP